MGWLPYGLTIAVSNAVPKAQVAPQLLILADPLLREGLIRLLSAAEPAGGRFRTVCRPEQLEGAPQLVLWSAPSGLPAETLAAELHHLRERWQPAPLLLLLPAEATYPSDWLLQLPAEGLIQQGDTEADDLQAAVQTLLAGGRVVELRPVAASSSEPQQALGLGPWLLQSGLVQIDAEQRRCEQWLQLAVPGGLSQLLLLGRLRELTVARRLLLWLWGPVSMAFPAPTPAQAAGPRVSASQPSGVTAITLRERTAVGVWQAIQERLVAATQAGLSNHSGQRLALEGLTQEHRRDLLLALISQLDLLIIRLRHDQLRGEQLEQRWQSLQPELRRLALRQMAGEYVQLPQQGSLLPVADTLSSNADLDSVDPELPAPLPMLAALVQAQPLLVDGRLLAPDEPQALLQLEALISNWLIRNAELISAELLTCCSNWPELRRYLLGRDLLATRNLERLRNQLNAQQRWGSWFERPVQLYESQRLLYKLEAGAITPLTLTEPRDGELRQLGWVQQLVTLALESRDALAPQLQALLRRLGNLVVVVLTQVIGRAIGLVGRGIVQGMGRSISRG
jgi:DNA-binding NarL/FixJ family response regulator